MGACGGNINTRRRQLLDAIIRLSIALLTITLLPLIGRLTGVDRRGIPSHGGKLLAAKCSGKQANRGDALTCKREGFGHVSASCNNEFL